MGVVTECTILHSFMSDSDARQLVDASVRDGSNTIMSLCVCIYIYIYLYIYI